MKTKKPIHAKSTSRLLANVFPSSFKMVNDTESNGYKYINLLYGAEVDEARSRMGELYANTFLDSMDYSNDGSVYQVYLDGVPQNGYVYGDGIPIKLTEANEFDYGNPTRMLYNSTVSGIVPSGYNIVGLEYYRSSIDGSGYFLVNTDVRQRDSIVSGLVSTLKIPIDRDGIISTSESLSYGVRTQAYNTNGIDDLLVPEDSRTLRSLYPLTRVIKDEVETEHAIDHYEPYHGWTRNIDNEIVAVVDYDGDYYYDEAGLKIYHRTARNNPYGSGNYSTVYLSLLHTPISGTLRLFDVNNLDASGLAVEIPSSGKSLYRYQYSDVLNSEEGNFEPLYVGYDQIVPLDRGFIYSAGASGTLMLTTSWDYVHEGSRLNSDNGLYEEITSGNLTNLIKIQNPYSRYIAEYQYETASKVKYLSSLESTKFVRVSGVLPIYTIEDTLGNLRTVDYSFSKDTSVDENTRKQLITFNGLEVRPGSLISQIDINVPVVTAPLSTTKNVTLNLVNAHLGYSNEFIPEDRNRIYWINVPFTSPLTGNETDVSGNGNHFEFVASGDYRRSKINYGSNYGKRLQHTSGSQYYSCVTSGLYSDDFYFKFGAKLRLVEASELIDYAASSRYIYLEVLSNGKLKLTSNNIEIESRLAITTEPFELIVHHVYNTLNSLVPLYALYLKTDSFFQKLDTITRATSLAHDTEISRFKLFKNCNIDLDYFQMYGELVYNGLG